MTTGQTTWFGLRRGAAATAGVLVLVLAGCVSAAPSATPGVLHPVASGVALPTFAPVGGSSAPRPSLAPLLPTFAPLWPSPVGSNAIRTAPPSDAAPTFAVVPSAGAPSAWPSPRVPLTGTEGLGPPAWVTPGLRLTWYGATASIAEAYYTYVEDENGEWQDPTTGKRYHRTDQDPEGMPTAASEAFTQTDVVAVEGSDVAISTTLYSIDLLAQQYTMTPLGGSRSAGAIVEGAWIHPDLLAQVLTTGYQGLQILRGPYVLGETTFDAISFVSTEGAYQSSTYDMQSGILLSTNSNTQGAGSPVHGPYDNPQGNTQVTLTRLVGVRVRSVPGLEGAAPDWVGGSPTLSYAGQDVLVNPMDPSARFVYPVQATVRLAPAGATWATFTGHTTMDLDGYPQSADSAGVTGGAGTYWFDPTALATFGAGDVLDEDPVTGARSTVESLGQGPFGAAVTILTELNGVALRTVYDRDCGVLVSLDLAQSVVGTTLQLQLEALPPGV